jgi:hypothetical protein
MYGRRLVPDSENAEKSKSKAGKVGGGLMVSS